jgi:hypothetical protein
MSRMNLSMTATSGEELLYALLPLKAVISK